MPRITVSGHRGFNPGTTRLVDDAIRAALAAGADNVTGLSCLADGADQAFLSQGGQRCRAAVGRLGEFRSVHRPADRGFTSSDTALRAANPTVSEILVAY